MSSPDISVIIPVRNGGEALERCLAAVWAQEAGPWRFEVLVVDNGSPEDTRQRVGRFPGTTLLFEERPSSYAARNLGIASATGRFLAFTDADTEPAPDWLHRGADALSADGGPLIVAGNVEITLPDPQGVLAIYDKMHNMLQERYVREGGYGVTANLFAPRDLVEMTGRFQEDWVSGADVDFCRRALTAGGRITYLPDALVRHPARTTFAQYRAKKIRIGRGRARLTPGWPALVGSIPLLFWPGVHAWRPRFQIGPRLRPLQALAIQLLHWLGKWYSFRGRLRETLSPR